VEVKLSELLKEHTNYPLHIRRVDRHGSPKVVTSTALPWVLQEDLYAEWEVYTPEPAPVEQYHCVVIEWEDGTVSINDKHKSTGLKAGIGSKIYGRAGEGVIVYYEKLIPNPLLRVSPDAAPLVLEKWVMKCQTERLRSSGTACKCSTCCR